jgi:hypothetical protein
MADAIDSMISAFSLPSLIDEIEAGQAGQAGQRVRTPHAAVVSDGNGVVPPGKRQAGQAGQKQPILAVQAPAESSDGQSLTFETPLQAGTEAGQGVENWVVPLRQAGQAGQAFDWRSASDARELMQRAALSFGGLFLLSNGRPVWRARQAKPPQELLDAFAARSAECAKALASETISGDPACQSALADCMARLQAMPYPADIEVDRWSLFLTDAAAFLSLWGPQAERTGWRPSDLFAVPGGLLWDLAGREVVALSVTPSEATIRARDARPGPGATAAFHCPVKSLPLPWESQS